MGIVILNLIGQCGPLLGTNVFPESDSPRYVRGNSICAAFMVFNGFLALVLRTFLKWENKKLERKERESGGSASAESIVEAGAERSDGEKGEMGVRESEGSVGEENYGRGFRYVL